LDVLTLVEYITLCLKATKAGNPTNSGPKLFRAKLGGVNRVEIGTVGVRLLNYRAIR